VERIARRISAARDSNFGVIFDVVTRPDANSNAYTTIELPAMSTCRPASTSRAFSSSTAGEPGHGRRIELRRRLCLAEHLRRPSPRPSGCWPRPRSAFASMTGLRLRLARPVIGLGRTANHGDPLQPRLTEPLEVAGRFAAVYGALRRFDSSSWIRASRSASASMPA
jgi:hypothetical protein